MATSDCASDLASSTAPVEEDAQEEDAQTDDARIEAPLGAFDGASRRLRALFFGFAATVTLGLALGSWYVGLRIVAVNQAVPSHASSTARENLAAVPAPAPSAGLYLELAGLGPAQDAGLVKSLQAQGLHVRQSGDQNDARILIGPFPTHDEMQQAQRTLQSAGVLTSETAH